MSVHQPLAALQVNAHLVAAPLRRNRAERVFDIHPAVHMMLAGAYLSFVGILCAAFMGPDLVVPAAIFLVGIVALFLTPALWASVAAGNDGAPRQSWDEFLRQGVDCFTGRLATRDALAQILVLPGLMLGLGAVFAVIKATL